MRDGVPNWKAVSPEDRKKVGPLVRHYMKQAHPFTACVRDNTKRFGPGRVERVCAVVKDMGERSTHWRKGGGGKKVTEAPADVDFDALVADHWDAVVAPALDAGGVTLDEFADWTQMAKSAGVLEAVEVTDADALATAASRVVEAGAVMARGKRRPGESLAAFGERMKRADTSAQKAAAAKTRSGKPVAGGEFEQKHPRGRGGKWRLSVGGKHVDVRDQGGSLHAVGSRHDIMQFQRRHGLKVDGIIGKQTASALLGNKAASKVGVGKLKDDQRERLLKAKAKRGRVKEAANLDALADVTFTPGELVEAARGCVTS